MDKKMTKRQVAALETRKKIIEAARIVISKKGFEAVSIDDIMAEAGLGKGTFYTHFERKEDVVYELNKTDFYRLAEIVNDMEDKDIMEKLEYYCREFMKSIERSGIEICRQWIKNNLSGNTMCGIEDKDGNAISKYRYDYQAMHSVLSEAVRRGQLIADTPVDALSLLFNAELYGLMTAWCMSDGAAVGSENIKAFRTYMLEQSIRLFITK